MLARLRTPEFLCFFLSAFSLLILRLVLVEFFIRPRRTQIHYPENAQNYRQNVVSPQSVCPVTKHLFRKVTLRLTSTLQLKYLKPFHNA